MEAEIEILRWKKRSEVSQKADGEEPKGILLEQQKIFKRAR